MDNGVETKMTCSINFNRRGKKIEVLYVPDEEIDYYYEDEDNEDYIDELEMTIKMLRNEEAENDE